MQFRFLNAETQRRRDRRKMVTDWGVETGPGFLLCGLCVSASLRFNNQTQLPEYSCQSTSLEIALARRLCLRAKPGRGSAPEAAEPANGSGTTAQPSRQRG